MHSDLIGSFMAIKSGSCNLRVHAIPHTVYIQSACTGSLRDGTEKEHIGKNDFLIWEACYQDMKVPCMAYLENTSSIAVVG